MGQGLSFQQGSLGVAEGFEGVGASGWDCGTGLGIAGPVLLLSQVSCPSQ